MEFLETHTSKDAKVVWKNDIDIPMKEEATEESDDESEDKEDDDESKESTGAEIEKNIFILFCSF
jgi:hypothetical protein